MKEKEESFSNCNKCYIGITRRENELVLKGGKKGKLVTKPVWTVSVLEEERKEEEKKRLQERGFFLSFFFQS